MFLKSLVKHCQQLKREFLLPGSGIFGVWPIAFEGSIISPDEKSSLKLSILGIMCIIFWVINKNKLFIVAPFKQRDIILPSSFLFLSWHSPHIAMTNSHGHQKDQEGRIMIDRENSGFTSGMNIVFSLLIRCSLTSYSN